MRNDQDKVERKENDISKRKSHQAFKYVVIANCVTNSYSPCYSYIKLQRKLQRKHNFMELCPHKLEINSSVIVFMCFIYQQFIKLIVITIAY